MTSRDPHEPAGLDAVRPDAPGPAAQELSAPAAKGVSPAPSEAPAPVVPEASLGLRLRLWLGCLSGALVFALGLWWVAGLQITPNPDPPQLLGWLAGIGGLGLVVSIGFALWLDHGIVSHLRGLTRGLASGRVQELRGLPSAAGWGELSELTEWAQVLITRQRLSTRAAEDLERLEASLAVALERLEAWRTTDRWVPLPTDAGGSSGLAAALNETFARAAETDDQNLEAARRVRAELIGSVADARDSSSQAERGFVEATALLTTVRELQRLGHELRSTMSARAGAAPAGAAPPAAGSPLERYREAVEGAIEELIASSQASVGHLAQALLRVQEIATQVQVVSQRATLVALHAVTLESRLPREERRGEELSNELRLLTGEVRSAAQNADALASAVERETRAADERMRGLRERIAPRLEGTPDLTAPAAAPAVADRPKSAFRAETSDGEAGESPAPADPALRLLERVREMIQDATQKGERLSATGERASRTAARLLRRLEDESREIEGLMVRLSPAGTLDPEPEDDLADDASPSPSELRVLERERARRDADDDEHGTRERVADGDADEQPGGPARRTREDRP